MNVKELIDKYEGQMLEDLKALVSINSVMGEPSDDAPFGQGPKNALLKALELSENKGFKTKNLDNYIGYAEIGEGEKLIGVVSHVDVVPVGDGWNTNPFDTTLKDGNIYGRGVSDDKGAAIASMYALKIIQDLNIPLNKRIRLIFGTNEENGSACLRYYVSKEGHIDAGFTPDGEFPLVYGEKGMIGSNFRSNKTKIKYINGGIAANVVCDLCEIKLDKNSFSHKALASYFEKNNIQYEFSEDENDASIKVFGVAAHASTPHLGINAISHCLLGLKKAGLQDEFVDWYNDRIGLSTDGVGMNLKVEDEYGPLTLNNGMIYMKDGYVEGTIDCRFPVTYTSKKMLELYESTKDDDRCELVDIYCESPLFYPLDTPMIQALLKAYRTVSNDYESKPLVIGGGTYAKDINNCVAFGCQFLGYDYHIHDKNEYVPLEQLKQQVEIYVEAIKNLLEV